MNHNNQYEAKKSSSYLIRPYLTVIKCNSLDQVTAYYVYHVCIYEVFNFLFLSVLFTVTHKMRESPDPDVYAEQAHKLVDFVIDSAIKKLEIQMEEREKTLESIKFDLSR